VLDIVATWRIPLSLPHSAQYTVAEGILRQRGGSCCHENEMKSRSRLNAENDLIYALSCVELRIPMLSNNEETQPSHWL